MLILFLLLPLVTGLQQVQNNFLFSENSYNYRPYYPLGILSSGKTISVDINFPHPSGHTSQNVVATLYLSGSAIGSQPGNFGQTQTVPTIPGSITPF